MSNDTTLTNHKKGRYKHIPEKGYFQGDSNIFGYSDVLGSEGLAVYTVLCARADKNGQCWPGISGIAADSGISVPTVRVRLQLLQELKIISLQPRVKPGSKEQTSHLYTIHPVPPLSKEEIKNRRQQRPKKKSGSKSPLPPSPQADSPQVVNDVDDTVVNEVDHPGKADSPQVVNDVATNETHNNETHNNETHINESEVVELDDAERVVLEGDLQRCNYSESSHIPLPPSHAFKNKEALKPHYYAISWVCGIDPQLATFSTKKNNEIEELAANLNETGYLPDQIFGFSSWWDEHFNDPCKAQQFGKPYPSQVAEHWPEYCDKHRIKPFNKEETLTDPYDLAFFTVSYMVSPLESENNRQWLDNKYPLLKPHLQPEDIYAVGYKLRRTGPEGKPTGEELLAELMPRCTALEFERLWNEDREYMQAQMLINRHDKKPDDFQEIQALINGYKSNKEHGYTLQHLLSYIDQQRLRKENPEAWERKQAEERRQRLAEKADRNGSKLCKGIKKNGFPCENPIDLSHESDFCRYHKGQKSQASEDAPAQEADLEESVMAPKEDRATRVAEDQQSRLKKLGCDIDKISFPLTEEEFNQLYVTQAKIYAQRMTGPSSGASIPS